jgi:hypothetical protein
MSVNPITFISQVTSDAGATVEGDPVYVGSQPVEVQLHGPGNLHNIQMSQDRINWVAANNVAAAAITAVGAGYHELREQPQWVRLQTAAGGVAIYAATFVVRRLDS